MNCSLVGFSQIICSSPLKGNLLSNAFLRKNTHLTGCLRGFRTPLIADAMPHRGIAHYSLRSVVGSSVLCDFAHSRNLTSKPSSHRGRSSRTYFRGIFFLNEERVEEDRRKEFIHYEPSPVRRPRPFHPPFAFIIAAVSHSSAAKHLFRISSFSHSFM